MAEATCPTIVNDDPLLECGRLVYAGGRCRRHYEADRRRARRALREAGGIATRRSVYSDVDVERGLIAVVMFGGNAKQAAEATGIGHDTLRDMVDDHAARYMEIKREKGPQLEAMVIDSLRGFMVESERVKMKALQALEDAIDAGTVKDYGAALKNIALTQGIAGTKVMELTGRPTAIIEHRSTKELMARLQALGAIDSSAEEIPAPPAILQESTPPVAESSAAPE